MRQRILIALTAIGVAAFAPPTHAQEKVRFNMGVTLWRQGTNLRVERATDFDGSDITASQKAKDWDIVGSGVGGRVNYELPKLLTIYGEAGTTQATVRDVDVSDPSRPVDSRGLDSGGYYVFGLQLAQQFSSTTNMFWAVDAALTGVTTSLDQDITTTFNYKATEFAMDGKVGSWVQQVGLYGGLRVVNANGKLKETDRTNPLGQQVRTTELRRDGALDVLVGARTRGSKISGFTEIGMVGTFSATAGLAMQF